MPFVARLPADLEDAEKLIERRNKAAQRRDMWRSLYKDCYRFAMPMRETFDWHTQGEFKNQVLFDSTLQDATYEAANTMTALLCPPWQRWSEFGPGGAIPADRLTPEIEKGLRQATETFFDYLNHSNFATVANEVALDLQVGTGAMRFDEGPTDAQPFVFSATPLAALELEEGPNGTIETVFMLRQPLGRNLTRMYPGMHEIDLPQGIAECITTKPDEPIEVIQGTVFHPATKRYYGVVVATKEKSILWRYDYGSSSPDIVARASKIAGEIYGRGRVTLALSDARTLDKMQEFLLRHAAMQVAPPMTGISDGVLNPYTAVLAPNTILPVGSNDQRNPSLRVMEFGGHFGITEALMERLRENVRRIMLGPEPSEGPVKSATEINIADRNRLWAMGGEYGRVQVEWLSKVMTRGVDILQRRGLIPKFKVDGREVTVVFTSPFARSQNAEDLMAFERAIALTSVFEGAAQMGYKIEDIPRWVARKSGMDPALVNDEKEYEKRQKEAAAATAQLVQQAQDQGGMPGGAG